MNSYRNPTVFIHIVTYNDAEYILTCLESIVEQDAFSIGNNLIVEVTDNASSDATVERIKEMYPEKIRVVSNPINLGFSAGHNQGIKRFLDSDADYILILNPDVALEPNAIRELVSVIADDENAGSVCPRLYRADEKLQPVVPRRIDSAGMYFERNLRHFDRGSQEIDHGQFDKPCYVFGGSGAAWMFRREALLSLALRGRKYDRDKGKIYPELLENEGDRFPVFDEAFFAYREDADLAWRAQWLGWRCRYVPSAVGYHRRVVLPGRRRALNPAYNRWSVRNRFLMQLVNLHGWANFRQIVPGFLRNALVVWGVVLTERTSLGALREVYTLLNRCAERRRILFSRAQASYSDMSRWFENSLDGEPIEDYTRRIISDGYMQTQSWG
ncbi:MAG: glycosyltransferase family 2 protein [Bdellovibrionales bacterium]|nr:glycosyltransferase family 2 protein [Bdellovibrionales bacterium]